MDWLYDIAHGLRVWGNDTDGWWAIYCGDTIAGWATRRETAINGARLHRRQG